MLTALETTRIATSSGGQIPGSAVIRPDFTAAQNGGRAVAVLEALTGQVFLATLVARLVAAYRNPVQPEPSGPGRLPEDVDGPGDDEDRD